MTECALDSCLQTPKKGSLEFQKMLEEAMRMGDAAAFGGTCCPTLFNNAHSSPPCSEPQADMHTHQPEDCAASACMEVTGWKSTGASGLCGAGKGGVKNSPLEGKPQASLQPRPTAEQRHFQDYRDS